VYRANVDHVGLLSDCSRQALAYDTTRGASPSVLAPLRRALEHAPGRELIDIGGGTGNYALALAGEGWQPVVTLGHGRSEFG
jgi:ubiquinone/menaquinone biosynthesis C-methylase UbiE